MERKDFGIDISKRAGALLLTFFDKLNTEISKGEKDFTLDADLEAEKMIINALRESFPGDSVVSEEAGKIEGSSPYKWVIDPLDGTANFKARIKYFCVSIGLEENGKLMMAFVYDPINDDAYFAESGKGAFLNGDKIKVSDVDHLEKFLISYSTSNHKNKDVIELGSDCFKKLLNNCRAVRLKGSSILDLCNLANGTFDGFIKVAANYWDFAPGCLIVEEAGGKVTDFDGKEWNSETQNLVASNGIKHNELLNALKK